METFICPECKSQIATSCNYCPVCGKKFHEGPLKVTIGKQISLYFISIFLPPFGLWPGFKYIRSKERKAQIIGIIVLVLTILSTVITVWYTFVFIQDLKKTLNSQLNQLNQLDQLQGIEEVPGLDNQRQIEY